METKEQELTPKQKFRRLLNHAIREYRISVRWLGDARRYRRTYSGDLTTSGESWKDGFEGELAQDASKAYKEAARRVLFWRKKIDSFNEQLMRLCSKKE